MVRAEKYIALMLALDPRRKRALEVTRSMGSQYWIAGGFVRNQVWDVFSGVKTPTPLNDVDVVYYQEAKPGDHLYAEDDHFYSSCFWSQDQSFKWEVRNQARMHTWHGIPSYGSLEGACGLWADKESCVMAQLAPDGSIRVYAPHGMFGLTVSPNPMLAHRPDIYRKRLESKRAEWVKHWPQLLVTEPQALDPILQP